MMRRIGLVVLSLCAAFVVAPSAHAGTTSTLETVATESFSYTAGANLTGLNGGTGWSGGWNADYGSSYLMVDANSLSVPGLAGVGGSAAWGGSFNLVAANGRNLAARLSSGVVWIQVIGTFNQSGGGTPTLRIFDAGSMNYYLGGNVSSNWGMSTASGSVSASSATSITSGSHIAAYRINMETRRIELWTDFDPSTFNYLSPPAAEASMVADIALAFDRIALYSRPGGIWDELKIMRVNTTTTYDLVYDGNGGEGGSVPAGTSGTGSVVVVGNTGGLSRNGYDFVGWSLTRDGANPVSAGATVDLTQDRTLYAVWSKSVPPMIPSGTPVVTFSSGEVRCQSPDYSKEILQVKFNFSIDGVDFAERIVTKAPWVSTVALPKSAVGQVRCTVTGTGDRAVGTVATEALIPVVPTIPIASSPNCAALAAVALRFSPLAKRVQSTSPLAARSIPAECPVVVTVTGYVQRTSFTGNDRSLSLARARAAASEVRARFPQAQIRVVAGGSAENPLCAPSRNRCAVVSFQR